MRRLTLKDVANRTGFSEKTISRVVNNQPYVNEATKQKILNVVKELGYAPNTVAKGLASRRTYTIGLVATNIVNPAVAVTIEAVDNEISKTDYVLLLCISHKERGRECTDTLMRKMVDGVIFVANDEFDVVGIDRLRSHGTSVVSMFSRIPNCSASHVGVDNIHGAKAIMSHLVDRGSKRVGFIKGLPHASSSRDRYVGYREFLADRGLPYDDSYVTSGSSTYDGGFRGTIELLSRNSDLDAIFCGNDLMALGAIDAAVKSGVRVPQDILIVGFDGIPISAHSGIRLTTVQIPYGEVAREAVRLAIDEIEGQGRRYPRTIILEPHLVIRA